MSQGDENRRQERPQEASQDSYDVETASPVEGPSSRQRQQSPQVGGYKDPIHELETLRKQIVKIWSEIQQQMHIEEQCLSDIEETVRAKVAETVECAKRLFEDRRRQANEIAAEIEGALKRFVYLQEKLHFAEEARYYQ